MKPAIKIENLSKQYRLGTVGTGSFAHDMNRWWHTIRGKEDPYLGIGESNDRSTKGNSEYVWALKDINIEVMPGEVLGIIGKNGAGKSTLLKLLSRVTAPTSGSIAARGRIASLLEVGTGFHPELTGRENVFLNGAIMGMTKQEIRSRFDEIVDFAGCERYIDTPVKRYSSGMYVRLAFAVAAHLEPEILVVDEVLAVGDAEFQKKAIGKMQEVSSGQGRTVLFVSHNMASIKQLCTGVLVLENGKTKIHTETDKGIQIYLDKNRQQNSQNIEDTSNFKRLQLRLFNQKDIETSSFSIGDDLRINLSFNSLQTFVDVKVTYILSNSDGIPIIHNNNQDSSFNRPVLKKGFNEFQICLKNIELYPDTYFISLIIGSSRNHDFYLKLLDIKAFEITDGGLYTSRSLQKRHGMIFKMAHWQLNYE
ncbi:MAG: ABC transporter ATP-binding protein [Candidatus Bathyarchaeota archaeon]|nr:ABC transporter ATP-binding protein [Candidatus Bathyarchaeota archaeon]